MYVLNLKVNSNLILKLFLFLLFILILGIVGISIYRLSNSNYIQSDHCTTPNNIYNLNTSNYTNVLKNVHDNLNNYIGQEISFSGYVYRIFDFSDTQFVLARDMIVDSNSQSLVVGFLCDYDNAKSFSSGCWVSIIGKIEKGNYHGEIPIIKIKEIKQIEKPTDEFVYPPDQTYVPTSSVL